MFIVSKMCRILLFESELGEKVNKKIEACCFFSLSFPVLFFVDNVKKLVVSQSNFSFRSVHVNLSLS